MEPTQPWEETAMDFIVEFPESGENTVIWTVIDLFFKQTHFEPPISPETSQDAGAADLSTG